MSRSPIKRIILLAKYKKLRNKANNQFREDVFKHNGDRIEKVENEK